MPVMDDQISPTGWIARFEPRRSRQVERFSEAGDALVVNELTGRLVPAKDVAGFQQLEQCGRQLSVIAAAPGWRTTGIDDGDRWEEPVVAWFVNDSGVGQPMTVWKEEGRLAVANLDGSPYTLLAPDDPTPDADAS